MLLTAVAGFATAALVGMAYAKTFTTTSTSTTTTSTYTDPLNP